MSISCAVHFQRDPCSIVCGAVGVSRLLVVVGVGLCLMAATACTDTTDTTNAGAEAATTSSVAARPDPHHPKDVPPPRRARDLGDRPEFPQQWRGTDVQPDGARGDSGEPLPDGGQPARRHRHSTRRQRIRLPAVVNKTGSSACTPQALEPGRLDYLTEGPDEQFLNGLIDETAS